MNQLNQHKQTIEIIISFEWSGNYS